MRGIDTNILVRFLVRDDENQAKKVYSLFKSTELKKEELFVSLIVIVELIWVLETVYKISRDKLLESLTEMILIPIFKFEQVSVLQKFLVISKDNNFDLSDLLIATLANNQGCEKVFTFDKRASKHNLFELLD